MKMTYKIEFTLHSKKQLKKLDKNISCMIMAYLLKNIQGSENPREKGKALIGNLKDRWRYRVGDYRIICRIEDEKVIVLALEIGNRKEIYK